MNPCSFFQFPPEIFFKIVDFNSPSNNSFPTLVESSQKVWHAISLKFASKQIYQTIHTKAFLLLTPYLHPYPSFLSPKTNGEFPWKGWSQLYKWFHKDPEILYKTLTAKGIDHHVSCDQGKITLQGLCGNTNDFYGKSHFFKISEENSLETIPLEENLASIQPTSYGSSQNFFVIVSNRDTIYLQDRKTNNFVDSIVFQNEEIFQIELEEEKLYVMTKKNIEDKQTPSQEMLVFNLSCKEKKIKKRLLISLSADKFYLCENFIFFLKQAKTEEDQESILVIHKETLKIVDTLKIRWNYPNRSEYFSILSNVIPEVCSGDNGLFCMTKQELSIQIDQVKMDQEGFHTSQWKLSLNEIADKFSKANFERAAICQVQYHLEKIFIYLSNHFLLVYDLHSKERANSLHSFITLSEGFNPLWKWDNKNKIRFPQILASSLSIHCLFLSVYCKQLDSIKRQNHATIQILTLNYIPK